MTTIYNASDWRRRAAEMRAIADNLSVLPLAQAHMLRIAVGYEHRAERAEERPPLVERYDRSTRGLGHSSLPRPDDTFFTASAGSCR